MKMLEERFCSIQEELGLTFDIKGALKSLKKELNKQIPLDYLVSRGEYYTALLMAEYLGFPFVDAKDLIFFQYDGTIDYTKTEQVIKDTFEKHSCFVVPGFYGSYPNGAIRIMSRGGSDITGSIMARRSMPLCMKTGPMFPDY
jgi:aspartate kinase